MQTKIGFDLDRIFINYPPFIPHFIIDFLYRNNFSKSLSYRIPKDSFEVLIRQLSHLPPFRPPIKDNIEFLHQFVKTHPQVYLISSRYSFLKDITHQLLKKHGLNDRFLKVYLNSQNEQPHFFKERIINKLNLGIYIDDDLALLEYLKQRCPKTKLFWYNPGSRLKIFQGIEVLKNLNDLKSYLPQ